MRRRTNSFLIWLSVFAVSLLAGTLTAEVGKENDPFAARCPAEEIAEAKAKKNPMPPTAENIALGKELYEGKGLCATCHGISGKGDGDAGKALDPAPRDFTNKKFHGAKSDGELQCVQRNGSPGTGMISYVPAIITEEEGWLIIHYDRTLAGLTPK